MRDLVEKLGAREPGSIPAPAGIPDAEIVKRGGRRLVLVRCRACEAGQMAGVRRLDDGRLVVGVPWVPLSGAGAITTRCPACGQGSSVPEAKLVSAAEEAERNDGMVTIRVGRRSGR